MRVSDATPEQMATMSRVLELHCASHGVEIDGDAYVVLARRVWFLVGAGVSDPELLAALIAPRSDALEARRGRVVNVRPCLGHDNAGIVRFKSAR